MSALEPLGDDPLEITEAARMAVENLLPTKSGAVYEAAFVKFAKWCSEKNATSYSENVLLAYFLEMAQKLKSSSLWAHYSMIKSVLNLKHNVNIEKYNNLRAFLKKQGEGYIPKKSRVLSWEQFHKFLSDAPDEKYLAIKVIKSHFVFIIIKYKPTLVFLDNFDIWNIWGMSLR
ncbi:MAG: hypothetical protein ACRD52_17455 [Candidatus Acidiferrales bacterium]